MAAVISTVGVITNTPTEAFYCYRVYFSDGSEATLPRYHLTSLKFFQQGGPHTSAADASADTTGLYPLHRP
jgi:hypothetical protein